jgi:hypothetical protein
MQQQNTIEIPQDSFFYDHLKCTICLETALEASESSCCHNIYCESCLTISKTKNNHCPTCRQTSFEILPSHLGRRLINTILTNCPYKCDAKITIGDLEAHKKNCPKRIFGCSDIGCEDFKGDHKGYLEHIIAKHADKIIPAIEAMKISEGFSKTGVITGFYMQEGQHPIEGTFRMENGLVFINTNDEIGPAGWKGEIDKTNLSIKLIKTYHGSHLIIYRGKFNKDLTKLVGTWGYEDNGYEISCEAFELNFTQKSN